MSEAFERNAVNEDEIRGWALRNGFAEDADGLLTAFYKGASINISIDSGRIDVYAVNPGTSDKMRLVKTTIKHLHLDQFDMLHGAALFSRFYADYEESGLAPPWFSASVLREMAAAREPNDEEVSHRGPRF